jgi:hypothetical protein
VVGIVGPSDEGRGSHRRSKEFLGRCKKLI